MKMTYWAKCVNMLVSEDDVLFTLMVKLALHTLSRFPSGSDLGLTMVKSVQGKKERKTTRKYMNTTSAASETDHENNSSQTDYSLHRL